MIEAMAGGLASALLAALLFGVLLDRALFGDPGRGLIERLGRALMFGLGGLGTISLLLDACGVPVRLENLGIVVGLVALLLAVPAWRGGPGRPPVAPDPDPATWRGLPLAVRLMVAGLLLLTFVGVGQAVFSGWIRPTFQFDAITRWMFKAKVLFIDGTLRGPFSTDAAFGFTHQRYPPLVSHVANLPCMLSRPFGMVGFDDRLASAIFPWYAVALVGVVYGALRRRVGPLAGALGAAWIANLPLLAYVILPPPGAGAASALADVPLSLFVAGAAFALADAVDGTRHRAHLELGLLLGFAALTKNEGLPLVAAAGVALLIAAPRARWRRAFAVCAIAALIFVVAWGRVAARLPAYDEDYLGQLNADAVSAGLSRLPMILAAFGSELAGNVPSWNLTWWCLGALLVAGGRRLSRPAHRAVAVMLLLQLGSYVFAYMITRWTSPAAELQPGDDPLTYLLSLTLGRLLMQVAPAAIALGLLVTPLEARRSG